MATINDKYVITFDTETFGSDTLQTILTIYYSNPITTHNITADSIGLKIIEYGEYSLKFNIDDYLLVPGDYTTKIGDSQQILDDYLFGNHIDELHCEIEVKLNGVAEFNGTVIPTSISSDNGKREVSLRFISDTQKVNSTMLVLDDGSLTDPLSLGVSLTYVKTLILKAYQVIDPSIALSFYHDWLFEAQYSTTTITNGTWDELSFYKAQFYTGNTLGDALKNLAKATMSFTGALSNKKCFFRKLFATATSQTMPNVLKFTRKYGGDVISYANSKNVNGTTLVEYPNASAYTTVEGKYMSVNWDFSAPIIQRSGTNYIVSKVNEPRISPNAPQSEIIPHLDYIIRSKIYNNRLDNFVFDGVNIDYEKNFTAFGNTYQILNMAKKYGKGITEIDALRLS